MTWLFTKTPLAFFVMDLWRDEAFSYVMARQSIGEILQTSAKDFAPPLYYIILHYWMMLFGTSEIALRSLSLLAYALLLFIIFEIMVLIFKISIKRALGYFAFIIINPFLTFYAFEARMYMMAALFVTLSYFALWNNNKKLYIVSITLALYTHYFTVFIFAAQIIGTYHKKIWSWVHPSLFSKLKERIIKKKLLSTVYCLPSNFYLPILLFLPWGIYVLLSHDFSDKSFWVIQPPIADILHLPFVLYTGYERVFGQYYHGAAGYIPFHTNLNMILSTILLIPIVFIILIKKVKHPISNVKHLSSNIYHLSSLYLWALFPPIILFILSFIATPVYLPRYFIASVPGLILLIVLSEEGMVTIAQRHMTILPRTYRALVVVLVLIIISLSVTTSYNALNLKYHAKRKLSPLLKEIALVRKPTDVVYLTNELDFHLAQYYIDDDVYIFGKSYDEIPQYVGKSLISPQHIRKTLPMYPARAFILHYDWYEVKSLL